MLNRLQQYRFKCTTRLLPRLAISTRHLGCVMRMVGLDHLSVVRPAGRYRSMMIDPRSTCGAFEVKNMYSPLIGASTDPRRITIESDAVDFGPIDTSPKLVQEFTRARIKHPDQSSLVRGRGTFGTVRVGDEAKERARVCGDNRDIGRRFCACHGVFRLIVLRVRKTVT